MTLDLAALAMLAQAVLRMPVRAVPLTHALADHATHGQAVVWMPVPVVLWTLAQVVLWMPALAAPLTHALVDLPMPAQVAHATHAQADHAIPVPEAEGIAQPFVDNLF